MEHPPSPSEESQPSRRESHIDPRSQGISPHPQHVEFRRESALATASSTDDQNKPRPFAQAWQSGEDPDAIKEDASNEQSSLLQSGRIVEDDGQLELEQSQPSTGNDGHSRWNDISGDDSEKSKSTWYLILLTLSIGGLQLAWAVELSNGSPYLLNLGISKSLLALVWIAGPLSGTLVQPYVGIKSDRCRLKYGKRRPFIIGGAIATVVSLMLLAWARELVGAILSIFGVSRESQATKTTSIVFAVIMIYILDFSINVIQAAIRAFIIDLAPTHQQEIANAWANRITNIGNIIGYLFGYADLPKALWFFGDTQFKVLCVLASLGLIITVLISCLSVSERDPRREGEPKKTEGVVAFCKDLYYTVRRLPRQISRVCQVQLFAWIGWFPFLFYITTYVGQIYVNPIFRDNPNMTPEEIDEVWERGTRVGTFAMEIFAITTFTASMVLPWFVTRSYKPPGLHANVKYSTSPGVSAEPISPTTPASAGAGAGAGAGGEGYFPARPPTTVRARLTRFFARRPFEIPGLSLRRAWMFSHLLFALVTWLTFAARTTAAATVLVALIGIPWALTSWAPFALIAAEIRKRDGIRRGRVRPPPTRDGELLASGEDAYAGADQAGTILGIHNVAIAAPQIVATLVSSAIFKALQKPRGSVGDDSVAWVLRFGGCAALVAAYLTTRVAEEGEDEG